MGLTAFSPVPASSCRQKVFSAQAGSVKVALSRPTHQPPMVMLRDGYPMKITWGRLPAVSPPHETNM